MFINDLYITKLTNDGACNHVYRNRNRTIIVPEQILVEHLLKCFSIKILAHFKGPLMLTFKITFE